MKTILHISKYYYPDLGGIETVAMYLAEGMTGYRNVVVCFSTDRQYHEDEVRGVKVYRVPATFSFMSQDVAFSYCHVLRRLLRQYHPDFCHVHCPNPYVYPLVTWLIPKETKLVLHWHSDVLGKGLMYRLIQPFENMLLRRSDCIISTSPNYIPYSKPLMRYPGKVRVAQNGLITASFDLQPGDEVRVEEIKKRHGDRPIVLFVGRHIPYKGIESLIEADACIRQDCAIVIAGDGPEDERLQALPCSERVEFVGRLTDQELRCYLHAANIFAFPSNTKAEAFGIALAEAMYCCNAAVTFTLEGSGVNWVSIAGETGEQVPLGDVKAFAAAIDKLLSDRQLLAQYAENAHRRAADCFTEQKAVEVMEKIYQLMLMH